jgi:hypothetical protein
MVDWTSVSPMAPLLDDGTEVYWVAELDVSFARIYYAGRPQKKRNESNRARKAFQSFSQRSSPLFVFRATSQKLTLENDVALALIAASLFDSIAAALFGTPVTNAQ